VYSLGQRGLGLWIVPANGGVPRRLGSDKPNGSSELLQPHILPGGTHALVSIVKGNPQSSDSSSLGLISLTDGRVTDFGVLGAGAHFVNPGHVVFNRGPTLFAAPFSPRSLTFTGPAVQLFGGLSGNGSRIGGNGSRIVYDFTVARDGGWLAYQTGSSEVPITMWAVDRRGRERQLATPEPKAHANGRVSPDGRRVAVRVMGDISRPQIPCCRCGRLSRRRRMK